MKQTQTRAILFADIKGYSENRQDSAILGKIHDLLYDEIGGKFFADRETTMFKVIGDGLLATCPTAQEMAEKALAILEIFENNAFEKQHNLPNDLQIRIALHFGEITEDKPDNTLIRDVYGANVILTARIEPIVQANHIFCTETFTEQELSGKEGTAFIDSITVGKATDQTPVELYALFPKSKQKDFKSTAHLQAYIKTKQTDLNSVKVQFLEAFLNNDTVEMQRLMQAHATELGVYQDFVNRWKEREAQQTALPTNSTVFKIGSQTAKTIQNIGSVGTLNNNDVP